jgi:hypothetical protein
MRAEAGAAERLDAMMRSKDDYFLNVSGMMETFRSIGVSQTIREITKVVKF